MLSNEVLDVVINKLIQRELKPEFYSQYQERTRMMFPICVRKSELNTLSSEQALFELVADKVKFVAEEINQLPIDWSRPVDLEVSDFMDLISDGQPVRGLYVVVEYQILKKGE